MCAAVIHRPDPQTEKLLEALFGNWKSKVPQKKDSAEGKRKSCRQKDEKDRQGT